MSQSTQPTANIVKHMTTTTARYRSVSATLIPPNPAELFHRLELSTPSSQAMLAHNTVMITLSSTPELRITSLPQGPGCFAEHETARLADLFLVAARVMEKVQFGYRVVDAKTLIG